jgi:argininosuccinate synthase
MRDAGGDVLATARDRGRAGRASVYDVDANLWGRSIAGGVLDDPWHEPPDDVYALTKPASQWPDVPAYVEIRFDLGVPTALNGIAMPLPELLVSLETIAGAHGIGRIDRLEPGHDGSAVRVIREAPAAVVLHLGHRELQAMVVPTDLERLMHQIGRTYVDLVYNGRWFTPTREALDALVAHVQRRVTGTVRVKLLKGAAMVVGRSSGPGRPPDGITPDRGGQSAAGERIPRP